MSFSVCCSEWGGGDMIAKADTERVSVCHTVCSPAFEKKKQAAKLPSLA